MSPVPVNGQNQPQQVERVTTFCTNTNLKAVGSYYVLTLDGGIFNHFGTQKERNLGLDKVTFSGKSLSPILKRAMRGHPMFMLKTVYSYVFSLV